jgi:hypothetical protein
MPKFPAGINRRGGDGLFETGEWAPDRCSIWLTRELACIAAGSAGLGVSTGSWRCRSVCHRGIAASRRSPDRRDDDGNADKRTRDIDCGADGAGCHSRIFLRLSVLV